MVIDYISSEMAKVAQRPFPDSMITTSETKVKTYLSTLTPAISMNFQFSKIKLMLGRGLVSQSWKEASKKQICVRKVKKTSRNLRNIGSRLSSRFWFIIVPTVTTRYCFLCHAEARFSCEFVYKELPCGSDVKRHICIHMWRDLFWVIAFNVDVIKTHIGFYSKAEMLVDNIWGMGSLCLSRKFAWVIINFCKKIFCWFFFKII